MAAIQDPQGAYFLIWQPNQHFGAALVNAPGALSWNELGLARSRCFQRVLLVLFGWTRRAVRGQPGTVFDDQERRRGQRRHPPAELSGPTAALARVLRGRRSRRGLAKVAQLGGATHAGPIDIGIARIAVVADPQGAMFALYDGRLDSVDRPAGAAH